MMTMTKQPALSIPKNVVEKEITNHLITTVILRTAILMLCYNLLLGFVVVVRSVCRRRQECLPSSGLVVVYSMGLVLITSS
jgi:hypothetical protein